MSGEFRERARRRRNAVEPVAAGIYFAPKAHPAHQALGFDGSSLARPDGIVRPESTSPVAAPQRVAGIYNIGGGPHFGSGLTIDTAAELHGNKA